MGEATCKLGLEQEVQWCFGHGRRVMECIAALEAENKIKAELIEKMATIITLARNGGGAPGAGARRWGELERLVGEYEARAALKEGK